MVSVAPAPLVLASASPQRRAILEQLGIVFTVDPAGVNELASGEPPAVALANAVLKADAVAARHPGARVLGVDTVVTLDGAVFGKPDDEGAARTMLTALQGRTHTVLSGVCLVAPDRVEAVEATEVTFRALDATQVAAYVALGEWRGRAGGYAIQERGAALVRRIDGDYLNVVGLPVGLLCERAADFLA